MPCPSPFSTQQPEGSFKNMNLIIFLALFHPFHLPRLCMADSVSSFSSWFKRCLIRGSPPTAPANSSLPSSVTFYLCPFSFLSQHLSQFIIVCLLFTCLTFCLLTSGWRGPWEQSLIFLLMILSPGPSLKPGAQRVFDTNFWKNRRAIFD